MKAAIREARMNKLLKLSIPILLILGLVLISGCGASPSEAPTVPGEGAPDEAKWAPADEVRVTSGLTDELPEDRRIVRTGSMTLEVEDIAETMDAVAEMADEFDGYVVSSYKYEYEQRVSGQDRKSVV